MNEFNATLYTDGELPWSSIQESIFKLEDEAFGDKSFSVQELESDFINESNVIILLWHTDKIIGFTYAKPVEEAEPERIQEKGETAWIWDVVISKEYRGRHLVGLMMEALEQELKRRNYVYIESATLVANNYAANTQKHYKNRIINSYPMDSKWGPQVFFRIKL